MNNKTSKYLPQRQTISEIMRDLKVTKLETAMEEQRVKGYNQEKGFYDRMNFYEPKEIQDVLIAAGFKEKIAETAVNEYFEKADGSYSSKRIKRNQFEKIINHAGKLELTCIKEKIKGENLENKPQRNYNPEKIATIVAMGSIPVLIGSLFLDAYITERVSTYLNLNGILQVLPFITSFALTKLVPLGIFFNRVDRKNQVDSLLESKI